MRNIQGAVAGGEPVTDRERPAGVAASARRRERLAWIVGFAVAAVALYVAYLRLSRTLPVNSDGANIDLMAWDMLHGNVSLRGWYAFDVSYLTTEIPQYALLEAAFGLTPAVTHIAAAMTYTLSVLLAMTLATGKAAGRAALARALIAGGIMLAPQYSRGVFVLVLSVGHIGASVPLLVVLLVLDRARPGWRTAVIVGLLLAWATVGDPLTYVLGSVPLAVACGYRLARGAVAARSGSGAARRAAAGAAARRSGVAAALRVRRYEAQLAVAALASIGVAEAGLWAVRALGGLHLYPVQFRFTGVQDLGTHLSLTWQAVLVLFGAGVRGQHGLWLAAAALHVAGLALAAVAVAGALWRWFRPAADLAEQVLAGGIVANLVLFATSDMATMNPHELAVVLPFGAVLAGRVVTRMRTPGWLARRGLTGAVRRTSGILGAAVLSGYLACLIGTATLPSAAPEDAPLAAFLEAHHLTDGVAGYWQASSVTVDTGGRVRLRALADGDKAFLWGAKGNWYPPGASDANFVVAQRVLDYATVAQGEARLRGQFGAPARVYVVGGGDYLVLVYDKNLLTAVDGSTY